MKDLRTGRECGECGACCKVFAVPEVGKHDQGWCPQYTTGKGCGIYSKRPFACQAFACIWLNGKGEESDRPDRLGVMMDVEDFTFEGRGVGIVHFWQIEEGAAHTPRVRAIAKANKEAGFIVMYHIPTTPTTYYVTVEFSQEHFSSEEVRAFAESYCKT